MNKDVRWFFSFSFVYQMITFLSLFYYYRVLGRIK